MYGWSGLDDARPDIRLSGLDESLSGLDESLSDLDEFLVRFSLQIWILLL